MTRKLSRLDLNHDWKSVVFKTYCSGGQNAGPASKASGVEGGSGLNSCGL